MAVGHIALLTLILAEHADCNPCPHCNAVCEGWCCWLFGMSKTFPDDACAVLDDYFGILWCPL